MQPDKIEYCTELSEEILKNIELSEIPLKNVILKCLRLCRLLGDERGQLFFRYESSGYAFMANGKMSDESWDIAQIAGRRYFTKKNKESNERIEVAFTESIGTMEKTIEALQSRLNVTKDPESYGDNISVVAINAAKNVHERQRIVSSINKLTSKIESVQGNIYSYILTINNQLVYGNVVEDIFTNNRKLVDNKLKDVCPDSIRKFVSVYKNLESNNPEDWANAVHSCRRILKDIADSLYPPSDSPIKVSGRTVKIGEENYINRLIQFIDSKSDSATYKNVVGVNLRNIGERIDNIHNAVCKGTHTEINKIEAQRYIIYTYLLLGDIMRLTNS